MLNNLSVNLIVSIKVDRDYPYLKEEKNLPDKKTCAPIFKNVMAMSFHRLGGAVVTGTDSLIMSAFVGLSSAGIYSNYQLIFTNVNLLLNKVYNAFTTSIGNLAAVEKKEKVYRVYETLDFLMFALYGYLSVGIFVMINPLIELLFGEEYLFSVGTVFVMVANFYITGMRQINLQFRNVMGLFWYDRYKPLAESVINLVVSIALVQKYGVIGILIGTIASSLTTCFWIEPYVLMRYGMEDDWKKKLADYFIQYGLRTAFTVGVSALSYGVCGLLSHRNILEFLLKGCICTGIYAIFFFLCYFRSPECISLRQRGMQVIQKAMKKTKR
jgi:O-antigen/teichoic acid export membrane protein